MAREGLEPVEDANEISNLLIFIAHLSPEIPSNPRIWHSIWHCSIGWRHCWGGGTPASTGAEENGAATSGCRTTAERDIAKQIVKSYAHSKVRPCPHCFYQPSCRSLKRCNFPVLVRGSSRTYSIFRGYLKGAITPLTKFCSVELIRASGSCPARNSDAHEGLSAAAAKVPVLEQQSTRSVVRGGQLSTSEPTEIQDSYTTPWGTIPRITGHPASVIILLPNRSPTRGTRNEGMT